jgi:hypothetical protein|tara:strand:+ start:38 stop:361 length:324 start_codon:yes stop_codon:yes gene_type:complete
MEHPSIQTIDDLIGLLNDIKTKHGNLNVRFEDEREFAIEPKDLVQEKYDTYWQLKKTAKFVNHVCPDPEDYDRIRKECHRLDNHGYDVGIGDIYISYVPSGTYYVSM